MKTDGSFRMILTLIVLLTHSEFVPMSLNTRDPEGKNPSPKHVETQSIMWKHDQRNVIYLRTIINVQIYIRKKGTTQYVYYYIKLI